MVSEETRWGGLLKKVPTEEVTWKGQAMPMKSGAREGGL